MRTVGCQKYGVFGLVARVTTTSGDIDRLELGCYDHGTAFAPPMSAADVEAGLEPVNSISDAEERHTFSHVVHSHRFDSFSEVLAPQITISSWRPVQNSIHDVTKFIILDGDDVLCFLVTGGIDKVSDEVIAGLLTLVECFSSPFERRDCVAHSMARFIFLDSQT